MNLIREDLGKIGKGALIAGSGAALFYILEALPLVNFGDKWTPFVVAVCGVLINAVRKWWKRNIYK